MAKFVTPQVELVGLPMIELDGLSRYLTRTDQRDFLDTVNAASEAGLSDGEILCSFFAKLCYKSLVLGKNANVSRIRDVNGNLQSIFDTGHGSVLAHANFNFVVWDCSRVATHEQCRHRVGTVLEDSDGSGRDFGEFADFDTAISQTSGRFVALGVSTDPNTGEEVPAPIEFVLDPLLEPVKDLGDELLDITADYVRRMRERLGVSKMSFDRKKRYTSALRRFANNGQANEIGLTVNITAMRHQTELRTSRFAEWEIRKIWTQIYNIISTRWPNIYYGGEKIDTGDGLFEVRGLQVTGVPRERPKEKAFDALRAKVERGEELSLADFDL